MAYGKMASLYDQFMDNAPYDDWVAIIGEVIESHASRPVHSIVDLGCGTGVITRKLAIQGYKMTGIDQSEEMLVYASEEADQSLKIEWMKQDITELKHIPSMDMAISCCDVVNYITKPEKVHELFERTFETLHSGGLFLFDVHSLNYIEENYIDHTFADTSDEATYIWFCRPGDDEGEMYHELTFFEKDASGKYLRFDETHHQRTFSIEFYKKLLIESGFKNIKIYTDFTLNTQYDVEQVERIFFLAEKGE